MAEEQHPGDETRDMQFRKIEPHTVKEHPEGAAPANKHRLPPPVVILST